jgi:acetyl-CoA C-acetyltransferase
MRDVVIIGIGQTPVGEHWEKSLRHLAHDAIMAAMRDAGIETADALYVGNMLSGQLAGQEHLGALIADFVGLRGIEAMKVEAACGSGAAALRVGMMAVASGMQDVVLVCGVEKMTDAISDEVTSGLATAADQEYEVSQGISFVGLNALLMRRYMHEYGVTKEQFAPFTVNAHRNGINNPYAMFRSPVSETAYARAGMIADPINLLDSSPVCDGAACVVLAPASKYRAKAKAQILASAVATDSVAVHDRRDPLTLDAVALSSQKAYAEARLTPADIHLFEVHDAFSIMAALSLEAAGFAPRGRAVDMARAGEIAIGDRLPVATMGGLKARGHPVGATGIYQVVEVVEQLTGQAGANQVPGATVGMAQNIGGSGATVITHILGAV